MKGMRGMDGIIIVRKEKNWTSNDIVQKIKGIFHEKVGHTGTLDPQATGVLPILIGKGTSLSKYLINHDKEYIATIKLGEKTSTGDGEGEIIKQLQVNEEAFNIENVKKTLASFKGKQNQIPPMYSAIKVNGKKLYEYARSGKKVEVKPRNIEIFDINLISISEDRKEIVYKVWCSKGTYIRTLCEDIAESLGTVGFMKDLDRIRVGDFSIENAVSISDIVTCKDFSCLNFISIDDFFKEKCKVSFDDFLLRRFVNGVKVKVDVVDGVCRVYNADGDFVGVGVVNDGWIKRDIVVE